MIAFHLCFSMALNTATSHDENYALKLFLSCRGRNERPMMAKINLVISVGMSALESTDRRTLLGSNFILRVRLIDISTYQYPVKLERQLLCHPALRTASWAWLIFPTLAKVDMAKSCLLQIWNILCHLSWEIVCFKQYLSLILSKPKKWISSNS